MSYDMEDIADAIEAARAAEDKKRMDAYRAERRLLRAAPSLLKALKDARDNGLIYWEPTTDRGHKKKAEMLKRINAAIAAGEPTDAA